MPPVARLLLKSSIRRGTTKNTKITFRALAPCGSPSVPAGSSGPHSANPAAGRRVSSAEPAARFRAAPGVRWRRSGARLLRPGDAPLSPAARGLSGQGHCSVFSCSSSAGTACSGRWLRQAAVAPSSACPEWVRLAVPRPFALAVNGSLALRPAVTPIRSFVCRRYLALCRAIPTETGFQ